MKFIVYQEWTISSTNGPNVTEKYLQRSYTDICFVKNKYLEFQLKYLTNIQFISLKENSAYFLNYSK